MNKYIQDFITNKCRSIFTGLTLPQKKSLAEVLRGLFVDGTPILRHLAQNKTISGKRQAGKYSYHLGNIDLQKMERLSQVYDSSEGSVEPGFMLHGVGVNNLLLKLRFHHNDKEFLGQVRKAILEELVPF